jgi:hypothetical protein
MQQGVSEDDDGGLGLAFRCGHRRCQVVIAVPGGQGHRVWLCEPTLPAAARALDPSTRLQPPRATFAAAASSMHQIVEHTCILCVTWPGHVVRRAVVGVEDALHRTADRVGLFG